MDKYKIFSIVSLIIMVTLLYQNYELHKEFNKTKELLEVVFND